MGSLTFTNPSIGQQPCTGLTGEALKQCNCSNNPTLCTDILYYFHSDHLGSSSFLTDIFGNAYEFTLYLPYGEVGASQRVGSFSTPYKYTGKELDAETGLYYYGARYYEPGIGIWHGVDPLMEKYPNMSPYLYTANNPINRFDPDGMDWVEEDLSWWQKVKNFFGGSEQKSITWREGINSQKDLGKGSSDKWLGKNVVVATHNRDKEFNEPLNTAKFEIYLESKKTGPSATFYGNTVAAEIEDGGVLSPGLYTAESGHRSKPKYRNETALLIGGGNSLPSEKPNPRHNNRKIMSGIFLHEGNPYQASLFDSKGNPYSTGCQTTGCGPATATNGGHSNHEIFSNAVGNNFNGYYYLRGKIK